MSLLKFLRYVTCASLVRFSCVAAGPVSCPDTIGVREQLLGNEQGWAAILDDTPHRLAIVTFYDGRPEEKASLISDRTTQAAAREIATWHFIARPSRRIWVACGYAGTALVLAKGLPPETSTCSVTYDRRMRIAGQPVIEAIVCK